MNTYELSKSLETSFKVGFQVNIKIWSPEKPKDSIKPKTKIKGLAYIILKQSKVFLKTSLNSLF